MKTEAVILDLGEVLIRLDFSQVMTALGLPAHQPIADWLKNMDAWTLYDKFERGQVSETDFFKSNPKLKDVWNSVLDGVVPGIPTILERLRESTRLFALTNTNETHLRHAVSRFSFFSHFEQVFSSHEIGSRKPEPEIYQSVERSLRITGDKLLFIDDRLENVLGARKVGWNAEHCSKSPDDLVAILTSYKLL